MTTHLIGTRKEWLAARLELLEAEKELTRRSDELARRRQELPWVRHREGVSIRDRQGERLTGKISSKDARNYWSITSCSGPTTRPGVRPARQ